jgi:hypothetical protein
MRKVFISICLLLTAVSVTAADIYKYVDDNGVVCYTDAPLGNKSQQVSSEKKTSPARTEDASLISSGDYSQYIRRAASKYDLEPELIKAVIKTESNGNHRAVSRKGAIGLMQLMPATASDMNVSNPFNPEENIDGGARYLKYLLDRFSGNLTLALAAYNSGPKTVEKYGSVPPIDETRQYVKRIFNLYNGRKDYAFSDRKNEAAAGTGAAPRQLLAPIYRIVLDDGTILFTNATLEKNNKTRL